MMDATSSEEKDLPANTGKILPDTSIPPPPLPPAYKTFLYPAYTDKLTSAYPAEMQMRSISLNWKSGELAMLQSAKRSDHMKIRESNQHINRYCETCSEFTPGGDIKIKPKIYTHLHNSSKNYRIQAPSDVWGNYTCFTCSHTPHSCKIGVRYPVIVSSSILNGWQGMRSFNSYQGDPIHIDYITIPGATVKDLHHAFLAEYGNVHRPIDVLLVAGLNDVLKGATVQQIMQDIEEFKESVRSLCVLDETWSSFAVATLPFPPKLVKFDAETRNLQSNYIQVLIDLTTNIRELNRADAHPMIPTNLAPCFHTWGMRINRHPRIIGPANLLEHVSTHRLTLWRELKPKDMLHLNDHLRLKMGKSAIEYFKVIYKITECKAKSKNEAIALRST